MSYTINGLTIPVSTRGVTGLKGVSYSPRWQGKKTPFVASMSRAEADNLVSGLGDAANYPYGGGIWHLGEFADARQAAYALAAFRDNPGPYVKKWQAAGSKGTIAGVVQFDQPSDLDNIPLEPILAAVETANRAFEAGMSEEDAVATAEKERLANLDHISKSQEINQSQDRASAEIQNPKSPLFGILKKIPAEDRGEAMDLISAGLKSGRTPQMIHSELSGWLAESRFRRHMDIFK